MPEPERRSMHCWQIFVIQFGLIQDETQIRESPDVHSSRARKTCPTHYRCADVCTYMYCKPGVVQFCIRTRNAHHPNSNIEIICRSPARFVCAPQGSTAVVMSGRNSYGRQAERVQQTVVGVGVAVVPSHQYSIAEQLEPTEGAQKQHSLRHIIIITS